MAKAQLYLIDGNAILHRAWHALPPLETKDGRLVNAAFGFVSVLLKLLREAKPTHLAVTFDREGKTFRHEAYKEYKANREEKPNELYAQIPIIEEILSAMRIPIYDKEGYEADDILGTIAAKSSEKGISTVIVTGDLDALQLIGPNVRVYTFSRGIKEAITYDESAVKKRYGLIPEQLIDFKALRGDPSDNIPGVRGIGEKTAAELIQVFGSIDGIYEAIRGKSPKLKKIRLRILELLEKNEKSARDSRDLVMIRKNVPVKFSIEGMRLGEPDMEKITKIFGELGFHSLLGKLGAHEAAAKPSKKQKKPGAHILLSEKEVLDFLETQKDEKNIVLRVFPRPKSLFDKSWLGVLIGSDGNLAIVQKQYVKHIGKLKNVILGHNLKDDIHAFFEVFKGQTPLIEDLKIASYLLNPGSRAHELSALTLERLGERPSGETAEGSLLAPTLAQAAAIAGEEADAILRMRPKLIREIEERSQKKLFYEIEMPLIPILAQMERNGVKIDSKLLSRMSKDFETKLRALSAKIYKLSGEEFNINSPAQLKTILFEKLKIPARVRRTTGGELSTAAGELEKLRGAHPIVDLIFEYREFSKLKSTYIDALPELLRPETGRVHTTFNQTVAATGRLSSSNPNLQNIPIRTELGREIRKAFIAEDGYVLLAADYSQIELRMIAEIAKVRQMQKAFRDGRDIHAATASEIWGVPLEKVTKEQRYAAKTINFGLIYGMGVGALAEGTNMSREEAQGFMGRYFQVYPEIRQYMDEVKAFAAAEGYVETIFGRRRYLPEIHSGVPQVRAAAERMAINAPVQGSAADLIKIAMIKLHGEFVGEQAEGSVKTLLQVHDELIFEVKKDRTETTAKKIKSAMESAHKFSVPVDVDIEVGRNWGDMVKFDL